MILASAEAAEKFKLNKAVFPGIQGGPLMHVIAGKAVCLKFQNLLLPPNTVTVNIRIKRNMKDYSTIYILSLIHISMCIRDRYLH